MNDRSSVSNSATTTRAISLFDMLLLFLCLLCFGFLYRVSEYLMRSGHEHLFRSYMEMFLVLLISQEPPG